MTVNIRRFVVARVQLALNVQDLDAEIARYSKMFGVGPAKVRPGYANFAIENPPLKLVLIQGHGQAGTLNHLGVEVESTDEVSAKIAEAREFGMDITVQESTTCCFAVQDKVWLNDGEIAWEWYTVLEDAPQDTSLVKVGAKPLITIQGSGDVCGPEGCCS